MISTVRHLSSFLLVVTQRGDRKSIPMFSDKGGFVIRAEKTHILCSYGMDGSTWKQDCNPSRSASCISGCGDAPDWCLQGGARWRSGFPTTVATDGEERPCFAMSKQGQIHPWRPV